MNLVMARSVALAGALAVGALSEALVCGSAQASAAPACVAAPGAYAFACTNSPTGSPTYYATLVLQVGDNTVSLSTDGFQGWISDSISLNIGGPSGVNTNYMAGIYNDASYNDYFGFNLSGLGSTATVSSATLILYSGLINEKLNYTLFGATQWISQLENGAPSSSLYHDLETGPVYDDPILSADTTDPMAPLSFTLDGSAVADINTAIRNGDMMFALSGHADLAGSVPEPSTWILMLAGFAGLGVVARRRAAASAGRSAV